MRLGALTAVLEGGFPRTPRGLGLWVVCAEPGGLCPGFAGRWLV
mgnify:CR=1 FL=1